MASKEKVTTTWLQCTLPKADWDSINQRRVKLGLKWGDIITPGTLLQLDKLEGNVQQTEATSKKKRGANKKADKVTQQEPGKAEENK